MISFGNFDADKKEAKNQENLENGSNAMGPKSAAAAILDTLTELTVASMEHAGFYLDTVLDGMSKDDPSRHTIFTLHICRHDKNGHGGKLDCDICQSLTISDVTSHIHDYSCRRDKESAAFCHARKWLTFFVCAGWASSRCTQWTTSPSFTVSLAH